MKNEFLHLDTILTRSFRSSVIPFLSILIALATGFLTWDCYKGAIRMTDLIARHAGLTAEVGVYTQDIISIQREINHLCEALIESDQAKMNVEVSIGDLAVGQFRSLDDKFYPKFTIKSESELANGKALKVRVEISLEAIIIRWILVILCIILAGIGMIIAGECKHREIIRSVVDPLLHAMAQINLLMSQVDQIKLGDFRPPLSNIVEVKNLIEALRKLIESVAKYRLAVEEATHKMLETELKNAKNEAIARMTAMLAHDIRKPFSMFKAGVSFLSSFENPEEFKKNLKNMLSEIERATTSVDGLISDVMEIGSTSTSLIRESIAPESLIESALGEIIRLHKNCEISLCYDLKHSGMVHVHIKKIGRVFSNILENALQAMSESGRIWFKTKDSDGFVEFCIGNAGPVIPTDAIPKLFDAFFTSGKKGGTGLGLAIAQKVIQAHGGKIWCASSRSNEYPDGMVEFYFTLPKSSESYLDSKIYLPKHSDEIRKTIGFLPVEKEEKSELRSRESDNQIVKNIKEKMMPQNNRLSVLLVDDEEIYRNGLEIMIKNAVHDFFQIFHAHSSDSALGIIGKEVIDLIITDIDMGPQSLSGYELIKNIKKNLNFRGLCFLHSNRVELAENHRRDDCGADGFISKPITNEQLAKIFSQMKSHLTPNENKHKPIKDGHVKWNLSQGLNLDEAEICEENANYFKKSSVEILLVEDDIFMREAWGKILELETQPILVQNFSALKKKIAQDPHLPRRIKMVITDMHLEDTEGDGLDVAKHIREVNPEVPIVLSSDGFYQGKMFDGLFNAVISKEPISFSQLKTLIR